MKGWLVIVVVVLGGVVLGRPQRARADDAYLFDHPDAAWWLSGQLNVIGQAQPGFHAPYSGDNSFRPPITPRSRWSRRCTPATR